MRKFAIVTLLIIVALFTFVQNSFAQDATQSASSDYQLPYPGLLPDSPLYKVKALRDRVIEFLISDPVKKAEFNLLISDKRLAAAVSLFEKGKKELAEVTISKGENYFEEGIRNLETARKEGRNLDPSLIVRFDLSAKKHKEILVSLVAKSEGSLKKKLSKTLQRIVDFVEMVDKLKL